MSVRVRRRARTAVTGRRSEAGFSLLEMIISCAIFVVISGAIYGLLKIGTSDRFTTNQRAELIQSARTALNTVGKDALNSGFAYGNGGAVAGDGSLGKFVTTTASTVTVDATLDAFTPIVDSNGTRPVTQTNPTATNNTDQVTFAYIDDTFNVDAGGTPQPLLITALGGTERRTLTVTNSITGTPPWPGRTGDFYVVVGVNSAVLAYCTAGGTAGSLTFAEGSTGDPLLVNDRTGTTTPFPAASFPNSGTVRRVRLVSYFVTPGGVLTRRVAGNPSGVDGNLSGFAGPTRDMPISDGVENMQADYVLASGQVSTDPSAAEMSTIRQIRLTLTLRSPEVDRRSGQPFRTTLSSTFNTRNIAYIR